MSNVHICFFTLLLPLRCCPKLLLGIVTSHKNEHAGLLVLHLLLLLNPCSLLKCGQLKSFLSVLLWYSAELAQLVSLPFSCGRSTRYSNRLHDFFVTIPWCYKDVYVNSFFPCTARLWNSLPIECILLTFDLSGFTSRINRHWFFLNRFFVICFLLTLYLIVAVQPAWTECQFKKNLKNEYMHKYVHNTFQHIMQRILLA